MRNWVRNSSAFLVLGLSIALVHGCGSERTFDEPESEGAGGSGNLGGDAGASSESAGGSRSGSCSSGVAGEGCVDDEEPTCEEGTTRCVSTNELQRCSDDGLWDAPTECQGETPFCNEQTGSCAACSPGETPRCRSDSTQLICDEEGRWVEGEVCSGQTPVCHPTTGQCVVCDPGSVECQDNAPAICNEDGSGWDVGETCEGETPACLESSGECGKCTENQTQCGEGDTLLTCDDEGSWQEPVSCPSSAPQCVSGSCEECDPTENDGVRCDGLVPQECVDNAWENQEACSGDHAACLPASGTCGCEEGYKSCSGTCIPDGDCCTESDCGQNESCNGGTCVCPNDFKVCDGSCRICCNPAGAGTTVLDDSLSNTDSGPESVSFCIESARTLDIIIGCGMASGAVTVAGTSVSSSSSVDLSPGDHVLEYEITSSSTYGGGCSFKASL